MNIENGTWAVGDERKGTRGMTRVTLKDSATFLRGFKQEYELEMVLTARARSIILDTGWISTSVGIQKRYSVRAISAR